MRYEVFASDNRHWTRNENTGHERAEMTSRLGESNTLDGAAAIAREALATLDIMYGTSYGVVIWDNQAAGWNKFVPWEDWAKEAY